MPYMTVTREVEGGEWESCLHKRGDDGQPEGESLGCHRGASKEAAEEKANRQMRAIGMREHMGKMISLEEMRALCPDCADRMQAKGLSAIDLDAWLSSLDSAAKIAAVTGNINKLAEHLANTYGEDPGFWHKCDASEELQEYDAETRAAICAKAHYIVTGIYPGEHRGKAIDVEAVEGEAVKVGKVQAGRNVARLVPAYRLIRDILKDAGIDVDKLEEEAEEGKALPSPYAVKAIGENRVRCYAAIWGDVDHPDLSDLRDFFTKGTDFWLDKLSMPQPMIYHHAQDKKTADDPVIGTWDKRGVDDVGLWYEGERSKSHKYRDAVQKLIDNGELAASSDSAPHLVQRRPAAKGTHEITRWPIIAVSLTPTPAEPRLLPVEAVKSAYKALGIDLDLPDGEADAGASGHEGGRGKAQATLTLIELSKSGGITDE